MKTFLFAALMFPTLSFAKNLVPNSFSTHFEETKIKKVSGKEQKSTGKIDYKFSGHIRYEITSSEEPSTFVTNNKKSWYYRPAFIEGEQGEVTIQNSGKLPLSKFLDSLKNGLEKSQQFTHKYEGNNLVLTFNKATQKEFNLKEVILSATGDAKTVEKLKDFEKLTLVYNDGQKVNLTFRDFKEDVSFPADHFEFKVPPKTKVTQN